MTHPSVGSAQPRDRGSDERGVVLVWLAITLVLLLGVAAFAIDVAYWHVTKNREQRAADAASLAGAVTFPATIRRLRTRPRRASRRATATRSARSIRRRRERPLPARRGPDGARVRGPRRQAVPVQGDGRAEGEQLFGGIFGIGGHTVRATRDGRVPQAALDGQPVEPVRQRPRRDLQFPNATRRRRPTRTSGPTSRAAARSSRTATRTPPASATSRPTAARASART